MGENGSVDSVERLAVLYVWDTREIVDVIDVTDNPHSSKHVNAIDNDTPLVDKGSKLPSWLSDLTKTDISKLTATTI